MASSFDPTECGSKGIFAIHKWQANGYAICTLRPIDDDGTEMPAIEAVIFKIDARHLTAGNYRILEKNFRDRSCTLEVIEHGASVHERTLIRWCIDMPSTTMPRDDAA